MPPQIGTGAIGTTPLGGAAEEAQIVFIAGIRAVIRGVGATIRGSGIRFVVRASLNRGLTNE
jgi:hypothetical protein